jgi:hypothetical protein
MTTQQIRAEMALTGEKIRIAQHELTTVRARKTELKAQMTHARQATLAARAEVKPGTLEKGRRKKGE